MVSFENEMDTLTARTELTGNSTLFQLRHPVFVTYYIKYSVFRQNCVELFCISRDSVLWTLFHIEVLWRRPMKLFDLEFFSDLPFSKYVTGRAPEKLNFLEHGLSHIGNPERQAKASQDSLRMKCSISPSLS